MANTVTIRIDPEKLTREFEKRNLMMKAVSRELGYNEDYFAGCRQRCKISKSAAMSLQNKYNIRVEEYEAREEPPAPKLETTAAQPVEIDYTKLYNVIYEAVYSAVKKAWSE